MIITASWMLENTWFIENLFFLLQGEIVKVYANDQRKITCGEFSKMIRSFSRDTIFFFF